MLCEFGESFTPFRDLSRKRLTLVNIWKSERHVKFLTVFSAPEGLLRSKRKIGLDFEAFI